VRQLSWFRYGLLLATVMLLVAAGAGARQAPPVAEQAPAWAEAPGLRGFYYVTEENKKPVEALAACAPGYHMASLWEILDPAELHYAQHVAGAQVLADQGSGPPAGFWGWVRTGGDGSVANVAGQANCNVWTDTELGHFGTIVQLSPDWASAATAISPWEAKTWGCQQHAQVWCVSYEVSLMWLPVIRK
jgi:hypothetical protein